MSKTGHPIFAALYDLLSRSAEKGWLGERRDRLLAEARGEVLEIGGGTGANIPHYRDVERVVLTEPDPFMRAKLQPKLARARVPVEVLDADAQALPFPDASFDTVVSTLVLCTVPNQQASLKEIRRVLRPGGRLLFLEHVRGEGSIARWQDRLEPLWRRLAAGCHPNRDTVAAMGAAGLRIQEIEHFKPPMPLTGLTPFVQGSAALP